MQCIFQARHSRAFHRFACDDACPAVSRARATRARWSRNFSSRPPPFSFFLWMNLARRFAFLHNIQSVWLTVWNNRFSRSRFAAQASRMNERKNRCHVTAYFFFNSSSSSTIPWPSSVRFYPPFLFSRRKKGEKGGAGKIVDRGRRKEREGERCETKRAAKPVTT